MVYGALLGSREHPDAYDAMKRPAEDYVVTLLARLNGIQADFDAMEVMGALPEGERPYVHLGRLITGAEAEFMAPYGNPSRRDYDVLFANPNATTAHPVEGIDPLHAVMVVNSSLVQVVKAYSS
jgi:hypothetical protein